MTDPDIVEIASTTEGFSTLVAALAAADLVETLTRILTYHVVSGDVRSGDIEPGTVATVEGTEVTLDTADGVTVDGANVIQADIVASNGVIHVIDAVILPADIAESL